MRKDFICSCKVSSSTLFSSLPRSSAKKKEKSERFWLLDPDSLRDAENAGMPNEREEIVYKFRRGGAL